jgi:hypothetical protein
MLWTCGRSLQTEGRGSTPSLLLWHQARLLLPSPHSWNYKSCHSTSKDN